MITDQQEVILDKIERVHMFFENLEGICSAVKEVRLLASLTYPLSAYESCRYILISKEVVVRSFYSTRSDHYLLSVAISLKHV